jgi:hypothetical protein
MFLLANERKNNLLLWFEFFLKAIDLFYELYQYYPGGLMKCTLNEEVEKLYECVKFFIEPLNISSHEIPRSFLIEM